MGSHKTVQKVAGQFQNVPSTFREMFDVEVLRLFSASLGGLVNRTLILSSQEASLWNHRPSFSLKQLAKVNFVCDTPCDVSISATGWPVLNLW